MNFIVLIEDRAYREIKDFPKKDRDKILFKIDAILGVNPFPIGENPKKLTDLKGFRLRVGDYRILYKIRQNEVLIFSIMHRKDVYR